MNRQVKQHKYIDSFTSMVLTARKIAVTVNSRQYQGISVLSHKKSRTIFVVQYGSDVFCSGITELPRVSAGVLIFIYTTWGTAGAAVFLSDERIVSPFA